MSVVHQKILNVKQIKVISDTSQNIISDVIKTHLNELLVYQFEKAEKINRKNTLTLKIIIYYCID